MLFGGALYRGTLYAGGLFGPSSVAEEPTVTYPVQVGVESAGYGRAEGRGYAHRPSRVVRRIPRDDAYRVQLQQDEEEVMVAILTEFLARQS